MDMLLATPQFPVRCPRSGSSFMVGFMEGTVIIMKLGVQVRAHNLKSRQLRKRGRMNHNYRCPLHETHHKPSTNVDRKAHGIDIAEVRQPHQALRPIQLCALV